MAKFRAVASNSLTYVALGSNLAWENRGPRDMVLLAAEAVALLGSESRISALYESAAWPDRSAPAYVNAVVAFQCDLPALVLLAALQSIEHQMGRQRDYLVGAGDRYAPRTLDLDLLAHGREITGAEPEKELMVPHPAIAERLFVLRPLAEVSPDWQHPVTSRTAEAMRDDLLVWMDPESVVRL